MCSTRPTVLPYVSASKNDLLKAQLIDVIALDNGGEISKEMRSDLHIEHSIQPSMESFNYGSRS